MRTRIRPCFLIVLEDIDTEISMKMFNGGTVRVGMRNLTRDNLQQDSEDIKGHDD